MGRNLTDNFNILDQRKDQLTIIFQVVARPPVREGQRFARSIQHVLQLDSSSLCILHLGGIENLLSKITTQVFQGSKIHLAAANKADSSISIPAIPKYAPDQTRPAYRCRSPARNPLATLSQKQRAE